jgi:hypothetical protein
MCSHPIRVTVEPLLHRCRFVACAPTGAPDDRKIPPSVRRDRGSAVHPFFVMPLRAALRQALATLLRSSLSASASWGSRPVALVRP